MAMQVILIPMPCGPTFILMPIIYDDEKDFPDPPKWLIALIIIFAAITFCFLFFIAREIYEYESQPI